MTRAAPSPRTAYRAFVPLQLRWDDNDSYGHLNNATYYALFDTAVTLWQLDRGFVLEGDGALRPLVVESGCRYHSEIAFPQSLEAGLRLGHLGRSSFTTEIALFADGSDTASAEGFFAQVNVGPDGRPEALPEAVRAALQGLQDGG